MPVVQAVPSHVRLALVAPVLPELAQWSVLTVQPLLPPPFAVERLSVVWPLRLVHLPVRRLVQLLLRLGTGHACRLRYSPHWLLGPLLLGRLLLRRRARLVTGLRRRGRPVFAVWLRPLVVFVAVPVVRREPRLLARALLVRFSDTPLPLARLALAALIRLSPPLRPLLALVAF